MQVLEPELKTMLSDSLKRFKFDASDPEEAYGHLVPEMVYANTADFRSYYERRKVK